MSKAIGAYDHGGSEPANENHPPHPHFYCKRCGQMNCLNPESLPIDTDPLSKTFPGRIDKVEVRVDGICKNCIK